MGGMGSRGGPAVEQKFSPVSVWTVKDSANTDSDRLVSAYKIISAIQRIVGLAHPVRVVAFGSRARGSHKAESDLDLAVMLKHFDPKHDRPPVRRSDLDGSIPIDLLVFGQQRHDFMKDSIISVHHEIATEGVTLYDAGVGLIDLGAVARIAR